MPKRRTWLRKSDEHGPRIRESGADKRGSPVPVKLDLEKALRRLEEIAQSLENEELELEEALRLFDEGMGLIRVAEQVLSESEGRLQQILIDRKLGEREVDLEAPS